MQQGSRLQQRAARATVFCAMIVVAASALAGCGSAMRERELSRVAKDWSMTIRASQVVPVYPLTEDLRPGDLFLVTTPIEGQVREYRKRGFLPLDQHKARLGGIDFAAFYGRSYGVGRREDTPYHWTFPTGRFESDLGIAGSILPDEPPAPFEGDERRHRLPTAWWQAPRAFFPSYTFEVRSGKGLRLALPIQSVPVGLGLMNTESANGSVQLADAYVYGVSESELRAEIEGWAEDNRDLLIDTRRRNPQGVFLRVVNRVYLVGAVQVSLLNQSTTGAGLDVAQAPGVSLFAQQRDGEPGSGEMTDANYQAMLDQLSDSLTASLPGGSLRIAFASQRSVLANETFDRPLVLGYIGLDYPVMDDGRLGSAVSTLNTLTGRVDPISAIGEPTDDQGVVGALRAAISSLGAERAAIGFATAAEAMPEEFQRRYAEAMASGLDPQRAFDKAKFEYAASKRGVSTGALTMQERDALLAGWRTARAN